MRPSRVALLSATIAALAFAGCSSSHSAHPISPTTSIAGAPTASTTTSSAAVATNVEILSLTGPTKPVVCNAPTQVELNWATRGAKSVTLQINGGPVFASYPNGVGDELVPLACDGNPQTYHLTAHAANGATVGKSLTITEREASAS